MHGIWRAHRLALVAGGLALIAATPAVLATLHVRNPWALTGATGLAAIVVMLGAAFRERYQRVTERRDQQAFRVQDGCLVLADGRLPAVHEISDPVVLGVHKPAPADRPGGSLPGRPTAGEVPVYVPRDIDAELRERLAHGGLVLLVGDSTAGKSRAAFEATTATVPGHLLVCPADREAVAAAVTRAAQARRCVLWLDDLERYLGTGGLTGTQLGRVLSGQGHVVRAAIEAAEPADADSLADTAHDQGRYGLAADGWRHAYEAKAMTPGLGAEHPHALTSRNNLALVLADLGRLEEAETEHRAVLNISARVLGPEHPDTLTSRNNLATVLSRLGRLDEAETEHRAVLNISARVLGPEHPDTLTSRNNLALVLADLGRLEEAETEHRTVLNIRARVLGPEHPDTLTSRDNLATVLDRMGGRMHVARTRHLRGRHDKPNGRAIGLREATRGLRLESVHPGRRFWRVSWPPGFGGRTRGFQGVQPRNGSGAIGASAFSISVRRAATVQAKTVMRWGEPGRWAEA